MWKNIWSPIRDNSFKEFHKIKNGSSVMNYLKYLLINLGIIMPLGRSNPFQSIDTFFISPILSKKSDEFTYPVENYDLEYNIPFKPSWLLAGIYTNLKRIFQKFDCLEDKISENALLINLSKKTEKSVYFTYLVDNKGHTKLSVSLKTQDLFIYLDKIMFSILSNTFPFFKIISVYPNNKETLLTVISKKDHPLLISSEILCGSCQSPTLLENSFCIKCGNKSLLNEDFALISKIGSNDIIVHWKAYQISTKRFCLFKEDMRTMNKKNFEVFFIFSIVKLIFFYSIREKHCYFFSSEKDYCKKKK